MKTMTKAGAVAANYAAVESLLHSGEPSAAGSALEEDEYQLWRAATIAMPKLLSAPFT